MPRKRSYPKAIHYTVPLGNKICKRIRSTDKSMEEICKEEGFPSHQTVLKWANSKDKRFATFVEEYTEAYKIRVNNWVEERDRLSRETILPKTPKQIADEFECWVETTEGRKKYDDKLVANYVRIDQRARESQHKLRIDTLTKNIGQVAFVYDRRYTEKKQVEHTGEVNQGIVMLDYKSMLESQQAEEKLINGEVLDNE